MTKKAKEAGKSKRAAARRSALVMVLLLMSLVGTSMLLLALAPAPLIPDAVRTLAATEATDTVDAVLESREEVRAGRWQYIYIHQSKSAGGDSLSIGRQTGGLGDHFLIGNGDGCGDGEIQVGPRWDEQRQARPAGATVSDDCISICLVGDFDRTPPTRKQLRRLENLVRGLQARCGVPAENVLAYQQSSAAGVGRQFPQTGFVQPIRR